MNEIIRVKQLNVLCNCLIPHYYSKEKLEKRVRNKTLFSDGSDLVNIILKSGGGVDAKAENEGSSYSLKTVTRFLLVDGDRGAIGAIR